MKKSTRMGSLLPSVILSLLLSAAVLVVWFNGGCSSPTPPPPTPKLLKWQVFHQSSGGLNNNHINSIFLDNARRIWLATDNGASYFSGGTWATIRDSLSTPSGRGGPPSYHVNCVVQAKDHSMWFGLPGGGIVRYNPVSSTAVWKRFTDLDLINLFILSGTADLSNQSIYGEMWFTSVSGISRFVAAANETGTWVNYTQTNLPQLPSNQVATCLTKLDDNTIWFGTQTGGAVSAEYGLAGLNWQRYPLPVDSKINSISFDLHNNVWFGTESRAWSFNVQSSIWTPYDSAGPETPLVPVHAVVTNHQETRWFGTDAGLARLRDTTWTVFRAANSPLPSDTINALIYDYNQNLWIGTTNGAAVYNESGIQY